jgi:hypothetical protein
MCEGGRRAGRDGGEEPRDIELENFRDGPFEGRGDIPPSLLVVMVCRSENLIFIFWSLC